jgi:hypothetical protein
MEDDTTTQRRPRGASPSTPRLRSGTGIVVLRLLLGVLGIALGAVLVWRGLVVVGVLVLAMTCARLALFWSLHRRRKQWQHVGTRLR